MRYALLASALVAGWAYSPKRGFVGDACTGSSCADASLLKAAWYYGYNPGDPFAGSGAPSPLFVPMHWCLKGSNASLPPGTNATFLLGYNEPNLAGQCNLSPAAAAASWANIMARFGTSRLVSPATAGAGIPWLTQFMANCTQLYGASGCRLSYVAVHDYSCTPASTLSYLEEVYAAFKLPVWLTEFSCGDGRQNKSQADNLAFMKAVFPLLDAAEHVYR